MAKACSLVEHFIDAQRLEALRGGDLLEEAGDHRHVQCPGGVMPLEFRCGTGPVLAAPQAPGGEDAVKERLNQCGQEEVLASLRAKESSFQGLHSTTPRSGLWPVIGWGSLTPWS